MPRAASSVGTHTTSGSQHRSSHITLHSHARTLTCFEFFPTDFWGKDFLSCSSYCLKCWAYCLFHLCIVCWANYKLCLESYRLSRLFICACLFLDSLTASFSFLWGWVFSPAPNPQPGGAVNHSLSGLFPSTCLVRVILQGVQDSSWHRDTQTAPPW